MRCFEEVDGMAKKHSSLRKRERTALWLHIFFSFWGSICLIPFLLVVVASFSNDLDLALYGYRLIPLKVDLSAYKTLAMDLSILVNAYKVTIFVTVMATLLSLVIMSLVAYVLVRKSGSRFGKILTYFIYFPTLFSGGLVPSYIMNTKYLGMADNLWILILPGLVSAMNVFMIRTFIQQQPYSLVEAAKLDGASEFHVYLRIAMPLAKPVLATVGFNLALANWNQWYSSMIYIRSNEKVTLQHLLQRMLMNFNAILAQIEHGIPGASIKDLPGESLRMAMLVIAIGPMMFIFPFFQKYFVKGMVLGSVKG